MIEDNWKPAEEDIKWTKEHFERMQVGDTWGVADAILKKEDAGFIVERASPASVSPLERIRKVCVEIGISYDDTSVEIIEDPQAAAQESAKEWVCPESGIPLVNFDLDNPEWIMIEEDVWRVAIHHPDDDDVSAVMLSPMDYHVLAGDDLFFSWKGMRVVDRAELIGAADMGGFATKLITGEFIVMTTEYEGELIPPHLRGLVFRTLGEEE